MPTPRVLFVGLDPALFDPRTAPPGVDAGTIRDAIATSMTQMAERGYRATFCPIDEGQTAAAVVSGCLAAEPFDCVVIGAGVRLIVRHTALLEELVDTIRREAPGAALAFSTTPADAADAVGRRFPDATG